MSQRFRLVATATLQEDIERLEVKRKRFPKTDAVYFISPTADSINHLLQDFSDEAIDVDKKPV